MAGPQIRYKDWENQHSFDIFRFAVRHRRRLLILHRTMRDRRQLLQPRGGRGRLPRGDAANRVPAMFEARFQTFDDETTRSAVAGRLRALRAELARRGLDGFVVPRADRQQNEYVPPSEERLAWLTAFTGSAGVAVVLGERAALFVDGRYTLQASEQVDPAFSIEHLVEMPPETWLEANLPAGARLGYDPWLHTVEGVEKLAKAVAAAGAT